MTVISKARVDAYILEAIDSSVYGVDLKGKTPAEKLAFVRDTFRSEYGWAVTRYGSVQKALGEWLAGLPSAINIEWRSHAIIELAESWGELTPNARESTIDSYLESWFNRMAFRILQISRRHNVTY